MRAKLKQPGYQWSSGTPCRDLDAGHGHDRVLGPVRHLDPQSLKGGMGAMILSISGDQGSMCLALFWGAPFEVSESFRSLALTGQGSGVPLHPTIRPASHSSTRPSTR